MSSEKVFEAMKTGQWETVKEIIATASWTSAELDKRHGVLVYMIFHVTDKNQNKNILCSWFNLHSTINGQ